MGRGLSSAAGAAQLSAYLLGGGTMLERIRQVLVHPTTFFAALPAPVGFPFLVIAISAVLESGASSLPAILSSPTVEGASTARLLVSACFGSFVLGVIALLIVWVIVRAFGGRLVHAWSIAGAAFCPSLLLTPATALAGLAEDKPLVLTWFLVAAFTAGDIAWSTALVFMGVRASAPRRAVAAAAGYGGLYAGACTAYFWSLTNPAA